MLGYSPHFWMKLFSIWLLLELLFYSLHFWLKETDLPVDCLRTESVRARRARCWRAMPVNGAELKICLLYKNYTHKTVFPDVLRWACFSSNIVGSGSLSIVQKYF